LASLLALPSSITPAPTSQGSQRVRVFVDYLAHAFAQHAGAASKAEGEGDRPEH